MMEPSNAIASASMRVMRVIRVSHEATVKYQRAVFEVE